MQLFVEVYVQNLFSGVFDIIIIITTIVDLLTAEPEIISSIMQSGVVYSQIDLKSIQRSMLIACKYLLPKTNTITKLLLPRMKYIIDKG